MKNVGLQLYIDRTLVESEQGDFNFTDDGLESGIAYHLSRRAVWALCNGQKVDIILDLKPALTLEKLEARIARESASAPRPSRLDPDSLRSFLPKPLRPGESGRAPARIPAPADATGGVDEPQRPVGLCRVTLRPGVCETGRQDSRPLLH